MNALAAILPISKLEPGVDVLFYSPDEKRAQRLTARLRDLAHVQWEDSRTFSPERWESRRGTQHLILLDYSTDSANASTALARQLTALAPGLPLFGVGSTASDQAAGVLAALRAGVLDFFDMDASDHEIRTLLEHALHLPVTPAAPAAPAPRKRGQLVLLLGVRPGVGASTLAAHLGVLATPQPPEKSPRRLDSDKQGPATDTATPKTLLLDLGQPAGDAELYLGIGSDFHYADALRSASRIDATLIRTALPHHASHLAVLAQGSEMPLPPPDAPEAAILVERLLEHVEMLLCDLGGLPTRLVPAALLRAADEIWLVADQGIASVVSLDACLRELERIGVRDHRLSLVINRHDADCGIGAEQIAKRFNLPLLATLPDRSRALRASANQGLLLHQVTPRDPYVRALAPLLAKLRTGASHNVAAPRWKTLFTRGGGPRWKTP